jgi:hypothetical protein
MKRKRGGCCEVGVWWLLMGQLLELRDGVSRQYDPGLGRSFSGPRLPLLFSFKEKTRKLWTERVYKTRNGFSFLDERLKEVCVFSFNLPIKGEAERIENILCM